MISSWGLSRLSVWGWRTSSFTPSGSVIQVMSPWQTLIFSLFKVFKVYGILMWSMTSINLRRLFWSCLQANSVNLNFLLQARRPRRSKKLSRRLRSSRHSYTRGLALRPLIRRFMPRTVPTVGLSTHFSLRQQLVHPFVEQLFRVYRLPSIPLSTPWRPLRNNRMRLQLGVVGKPFKRRCRAVNYSVLTRRVTFFSMLLRAVRGSTEAGLDAGEDESAWLPSRVAFKLPRLFLRVFDRRVRKVKRPTPATPHPHSFLNGPRPKFVAAIALSRVLSSRVYKSYLRGATFRNVPLQRGFTPSRSILGSFKKLSTWSRSSIYLRRRLLKISRHYPSVTLLRYARWRYYRPRRYKGRMRRRRRWRRYRMIFFPRRRCYRLRRRRRRYLKRKIPLLQSLPRTLFLVNRRRSLVTYCSYMKRTFRRLGRIFRRGRRYHRGLFIAKRGVRRYRKLRRRIRRTRRRLKVWRRRGWGRYIQVGKVLHNTRMDIASIIRDRTPQARQEILPSRGLEQSGLWSIRWRQTIDPTVVRLWWNWDRRSYRLRIPHRVGRWADRYLPRGWYNRPSRKKIRRFRSRRSRSRRIRLLEKGRTSLSSFAVLRQRLRVRRLVVHASRRHYTKFRLRRRLSRQVRRLLWTRASLPVTVRRGRDWHLESIPRHSLYKLYNIQRSIVSRFLRFSNWREGFPKFTRVKRALFGSRIAQIRRYSWGRVGTARQQSTITQIRGLRNWHNRLGGSSRQGVRGIPALLRRQVKTRGSFSLAVLQRSLSNLRRLSSSLTARRVHQRVQRLSRRQRIVISRPVARPKSWLVRQPPVRIITRRRYRFLFPLFKVLGRQRQGIRRQCSQLKFRRSERWWLRRSERRPRTRLWRCYRRSRSPFHPYRSRQNRVHFTPFKRACFYRRSRLRRRLEQPRWVPLRELIVPLFRWARGLLKVVSSRFDYAVGAPHYVVRETRKSTIPFLHHFIGVITSSPLISYRRHWSTVTPIYFHSLYNVPFLLSGCGFLFTQRHSVRGLVNTLPRSARAKLFKFQYSFVYKDDLKRMLMRYARHGVVPQLFTRLRRYLKPTRFPLQFQQVARVASLEDKASRVGSLFANRSWKERVSTTREGRAERAAVSPLAPLVADLSTSLRIKRIRFKPGYSRIWRRARASLNYLLNTHFRYQHRFTRFLHQFRRSYHQQSSQFLAVTLGRFLVDVRFVFDYRVSLEILQMDIVYVNGCLATNHLIPLVAGDIVQMIVSLKYYIAARWLVNWNRKERSRIVKLANFRRNKSQYDLSKQRSYRLPDWIFNNGFKRRDIPKYVEVDYFTLSAFILYEPLCMSSFNPLTFLERRDSIYPMYNFYYMT